MMIVIVLILLIVCLIGALIYCSAGKIPYDRRTDDDAQMEFLRRYEE